MAWQKVKSRIVVGIILVLMGIVYLLRNYDIFLFPVDFLTWEYFFILFGLLLFVLSDNKTAGIVFLAIGLFNLVPGLWPLIFVIIGLYIIMKRKGSRSSYHKKDFQGDPNISASENSNDFLEDVNIFGGGTKIINTDNFKGGSVVSIFGGSDINLMGSKLADGEQSLEVTAIFGGSTLIIPSEWKVELDVISIFGGFGDKRRKDPNIVYDQNKVLVVKGLVLFGGGEIKN
jgi:predicted membrane protein